MCLLIFVSVTKIKKSNILLWGQEKYKRSIFVDRRIYEMLEHYKLNNKKSDTSLRNEVCHTDDFCLETDYNAKDGEILTMAFVNMQPIESVYATEDGFCNGTIFPNIDKPFYGGKRI